MTSDTFDTMMRRALALAEEALPNDVPVGALIVDSHGKVIGEGFNQREQDHDASAHAEIVALRQAGNTLGNWRMTGCTLYVTLEPCPMCMAALMQARIGRIVYGADDPVQGACGSALSLQTLYGSDVVIQAGVLGEICKNRLQQFFQQARGS